MGRTILCSLSILLFSFCPSVETKAAESAWLKEARDISKRHREQGPKRHREDALKCTNMIHANHNLPLDYSKSDENMPVTASVVFIKIHKTGSATLQTILYQFALRHGIRVYTKATGFPNSFTFRTRNSTKAPQKLAYSDTYNVIGSHAILNFEKMLQTVPGATFVTMIRSPVACLRSYIATFGTCGKVAAANANFTHFAQHAFVARDQSIKTVQRYRNPNAHALGFYEWAERNRHKMSTSSLKQISDWVSLVYPGSTTNFNELDGDSRPFSDRRLSGRRKNSQTLSWTTAADQDEHFTKEWIEELGTQINLVMLFERYDESLLLLRKELNWRIADMVYMKAHGGNYKACNLQRQTLGRTPLSSETINALRPFMMVDHMLYDHYSKVFERRIAAENSCEFQNALNLLRDFNEREAAQCPEICKYGCSMCIPCGHIHFANRQRTLEEYVRTQQERLGITALPPHLKSYADLPQDVGSCKPKERGNLEGMGVVGSQSQRNINVKSRPVKKRMQRNQRQIVKGNSDSPGIGANKAGLIYPEETLMQKGARTKARGAAG